jgi:hypothetical protein
MLLFCSNLKIDAIEQEISQYNKLEFGSDAWVAAQASLSALQQRLLGYEQERRNKLMQAELKEGM